MRVVSIVLGFILFGFGGLQLNDPDPVRWVVAYGIAGGLCLAQARSMRISTMVHVGVGIGYAILAVWCWPSQYLGVSGEMMQAHPEVEEARESLGLAICALSLFVMGAASWRARRGGEGV